MTVAEPTPASERVRTWLREHGGRTALEVGFNFLLPFAIFSLTHKHIGDAKGLMASSAAPIVWSLVEFARHRRVDALSMIVLAGIALGLLAFIGGGGPKFLQLREALVGGVIALVFLGSAAIGKPLIYELARATMLRQGQHGQLAELESMKDNVHVRHTMMVLTLVWGFGLLAHTAVACVLVFAVSIKTYLLVAPIIGYGTTGALFAWMFWYIARRRRLGRARMAAEQAAAQAQSAPVS
ncbi:MAG TPA: VC0807 family protein [Caulobacteraceae bacterium]|nr:VC0807 family protein [Caulobacteraceae bacterium]